MKRFWLKVGVTLGAALFGSAVVPACAHDDSTIFIRQVFAPSIPTNGMCTFTADTTGAYLSGGIVDVGFPGLADYSPELLIGNQIVAQGNMDMLQTETSRVILNGAITRITDLAGDTSLETMFAGLCAGGSGDQAACSTGRALQAGKIATPVNPFSTVEAGAIEPASSSTPNYGLMSTTLVDGATIQVMRAYFLALLQANASLGLENPAFTTSIQLLTFTKVEGVTLGGDPVESNEFEFPVTFTFGQLVANGFVADPTSAAGVCLPGAKPVTTCVAGQDAVATTTSVVGVQDCLGSVDAGTIGATPDGGGGG